MLQRGEEDQQGRHVRVHWSHHAQSTVDLGRHALGPSYPGGHEPSCSRPTLKKTCQRRRASAHPTPGGAFTSDEGGASRWTWCNDTCTRAAAKVWEKRPPGWRPSLVQSGFSSEATWRERRLGTHTRRPCGWHKKEHAQWHAATRTVTRHNTYGHPRTHSFIHSFIQK